MGTAKAHGTRRGTQSGHRWPLPWGLTSRLAASCLWGWVLCLWEGYGVMEQEPKTAPLTRHPSGPARPCRWAR